MLRYVHHFILFKAPDFNTNEVIDGTKKRYPMNLMNSMENSFQTSKESNMWSKMNG